MKKEIKYTNNKYSVFCGKIEIARAYVRYSDDECGVRILQGMPRMETADKIIKDCPEFAKENNLNENSHCYLFAK